jgi:hypothetical protein
MEPDVVVVKHEEAEVKDEWVEIDLEAECVPISAATEIVEVRD